MVDYSKLSDFEINCEVAKANEWTSKSFAHEIHSGKWNPCQNPADAWPIIVANQISILYEEAMGKWNACKAYWVDGVEWQITDDVMDKNPLRAAMIVFLMMQDEKHG